MTILLPSLAVTFAAFVVWLAVRFVNRRERWARWMLILGVGFPVAYVGSFGPACWITSRAEVGQTAVSWIYWPLGRECRWTGEVNAWQALQWYSTVFAADDWEWQYDVEISANGFEVRDLGWRYGPRIYFTPRSRVPRLHLTVFPVVTDGEDKLTDSEEGDEKE
jgi:hypothetical protein